MGTLVRLAWRSSSFHDAVKALALLAEAENETWANNASREFVARFQIFLGGTAVPYLDRMSVLDELLATNRPSASVPNSESPCPDRQPTTVPESAIAQRLMNYRRRSGNHVQRKNISSA